MSSCTIVTCYYRFPSKHSYHDYDTWMTNFLTTVDTPIVIYCDHDWVDRLRDLRKGFEHKTHIIPLTWDGMRCGSDNMMQYWKKDLERDHEKSYHNQLLYVLWNEKSEMVKRVIDVNPFGTDFFCWCDIGCFRTRDNIETFKHWPARSFLESAVKDKMYVLNIEPFEKEDYNVLPNGLSQTFQYKQRIGGTIFLGSATVWTEWHRLYYDTMDKYMQEDYFAGKDQNIMASVAVMYPNIVQMVTPTRAPYDGDPWFYLQRYFLEPRH